jgi:serine/threonine-protein kinase
MELDPSALEPGIVLAGKFRVVRCLGSGGMGAVYEIEHELTKHRRALKMLHAAMAMVPGVKERFLREASAAGRVGNPHIAETFDAGVLESGEPYLVMELLRGETLTDRIARGKLSVDEIVDLIGQSCDGVHAAHEAGIIHRDLKPDNLFIVDVDGKPFIKILDFGISKFDPSKTEGMALTQEGAALGTPYYMSPEQIRGEANVDVRADVYALGVILYECAAGKRPFEAEILTQLAVLIHTGTPTPLGQLRPELPASFADVVRRAMATDRTQRVSSADELRVELERFGAISFRTSFGPPPGVSIPPPQRSVAAHSMATSAAGVSVRQAQLAAANKSQRAAIFLGLGLVVSIGVGVFVWRAQGSAGAEGPGVAGAAPAVTTPRAPEGPSAVVHAPAGSALPPASAAASPPASAPAPVPKASVSAAPFPVVAPTLQPPPPPVSAAPPSSPQAPATPEKKPRRVTERGLAEDNPFR